MANDQAFCTHTDMLPFEGMAECDVANGLTVSIYWDEHVPFKDKFFGDAAGFASYYRSKFTRPFAYHTAGAAACITT